MSSNVGFAVGIGVERGPATYSVTSSSFFFYLSSCQFVGLLLFLLPVCLTSPLFNLFGGGGGGGETTKPKCRYVSTRVYVPIRDTVYTRECSTSYKEQCSTS